MLKAKEVTVDLYIDPKANPPFTMKSTLLKDGKLTFKNDHHPGFVIDFNIVDDAGGYRFPDSAKDALAAAELATGKPTCPKQGAEWAEFEPLEVDNGNRTLRVMNHNNHPADFGFTMFVTKDGKKPYLELDPIGDNRNGPRLASR